ncbi:phage capsid protein [Pseudomonas sp. 57B-090624]|uniref:GPO family capsid scaffolding protein n=1 Tax=Pseudomonas sp. 57B-090624 TaxID=2213080 RepID=UPI000DAAC95F|nr:GPO family capsid scaffolding protein [Pseudomonas sp. 57B-090624]PZE09688.1 phage capsid protein [Pseudomonas sp. 57B-090624]
MADKPKKYRSKFFRVAVEGATTDGRRIERSWIDQMADSYDRTKYGARIWMEHIRSALPDSPFRAYGDVIALKAQDTEIDGETRRALYAQIEPTDDLVNMVTKLKQKIFTSIEVREKFAGTGKAYLMGLGVTDTPASLGSEMLTFAAQNPEASPLKTRKQHPDDLYSECTEVELEFEEITDPAGLFTSLKSAIGELVSKGKAKDRKDAVHFGDLGEALQGLVTLAQQQAEHSLKVDEIIAALEAQLSRYSASLDDLKAQLGNTQDHSQKPRPAVTGAGKHTVTDC